MSDTASSAPDFGDASNYTPPSYAIADEDAGIADAILSQDVASLPGTFEVSEGVRLPDTVGIEGLPPQLRGLARAKVSGVPTERLADAEAAAVLEVLRENSLAIRSKTGFAPSVDPFFSELADVTRDHNDALAEYDRLNEELTRVARWEPEDGPEGKPTAKPVFAASEARRQAIAVRQRELLHRMRLLANEDGSHGPEAQRRLDKALFESVERRKAIAQEASEREEAKLLAAKKLRDERVERAAEAIAKHKRPTGL